MKSGSKSLRFGVESCISEHDEEQMNKTPLVKLRLDYDTLVTIDSSTFKSLIPSCVSFQVPYLCRANAVCVVWPETSAIAIQC
jgi:hypothetical protein